jgi:hypothetical protein
MEAMIKPEKIPTGAPRPGEEASTAEPTRGAAYPAEAPASSIAATAVKMIPEISMAVFTKNLNRVDFPFCKEARFRIMTGMMTIAMKTTMTITDNAAAEFGHFQTMKKKKESRPK